MWDFDELVSAYDEDKESQEVVKAMLESLYRFLDEKACTTSPLTDKNGKIIKKRVYKDDLNSDGFELSGKPISKWMSSKKARQLNPDMNILEKALTEIRNKK
jgi:hypothetical protein